MKPITVGVVALSLLLSLAPADAAQDVLHLQVGDPTRREYEVPLGLDVITDSRARASITPAELPARLADVSLLLVGESHTDMDFHAVQLTVIRELVEAGRKVVIGLEMYPYTEQRYLDQWVEGLLTEKGFIELSDWYRNWGYHWGYYREIFWYGREHGLRLVGVNTPREIVSAVRRKGFASLSEEEAHHIPAHIDTEDEEHFELFRSYFDEGDAMHGAMSDEQWQAMFAAQCTWDATMGYNAVRALQEEEDPTAIVVVLVGSGHVAYGLGIQRQAAHWFDGAIASIIPVAVEDEDGETVETVNGAYAEFVWGLPAETNPVYPSTGLSTRVRESDGALEIIMVSEDSNAELAGFRVGDVLVSMDGQLLHQRSVLNRLVAEKFWGEAADFVVHRDGEEITLRLHFRRSL